MLFSKIIGQTNAKKILSRLYEKKHFPPLLFVGPKGVGKRTTAITFAQIINCPEPSDININQCQRCQQVGNLIHSNIKILFPISTASSSDTNEKKDSDESRVFKEIWKNTALFALGQTKPVQSPTNFIPIKLIRWLKQEMAYKSFVGEYKIIILLDADKMNQESANAFLKTLEEPQAQTLLILTTEHIYKIIPTIRSRCQTVRFSALSKDAIADYLIKEKQVSQTDAQLAAEVADGSLRKALDFSFHTDNFLPSSDVLKLFDQSQTHSLQSLNSLLNLDTELHSPEKIIADMLFIYRKALQLKLSIPISYNMNIIKTITLALSTDQIVNRISILLNLLNDAELHLNKKLFLFSILSAVRF
jgi:DNA polymerase III gamma/tau subunit